MATSIKVIFARYSGKRFAACVCENRANTTFAHLPSFIRSTLRKNFRFIEVAKFVLALPLYRQEQELKRLGISISRQTMANWVIYAASRWLKPIYDLLHESLLQNDILHADESTVQVIREDGRKASQKSYMWMYHTGKDAEEHIALFEYQPTREGKNALDFLADFSGFLHVDAYSGYKKLEEQGVTIGNLYKPEIFAKRRAHK